MEGALIPSTREYFRFWGLDREKLAWAAPGAKVMHPGPMNRGVEIDSDVADDLTVSLIQQQVEMGVAARMAVLAALTDDFAESDLPFRVDVVDWATTRDNFRRIIERDKLVLKTAGQRGRAGPVDPAEAREAGV